MYPIDVVNDDEDILTVDNDLLYDDGLLPAAHVEPIAARQPRVREEADGATLLLLTIVLRFDDRNESRDVGLSGLVINDDAS